MLNAAAHARRVLEVDDLSFGYGDGFRLDGISFAVEARSFTALLGPNGAGKTTLFSLLTRLFDSERGGVRVCGCDLREASSRALASMGVVFQQPTLDLDLTVAAEPALLRGAARAERARGGEAHRRRARAAGAVRAPRRQGAPAERRLPPARRDGARAAAPPALLLLDEPTVGLDVPTPPAFWSSTCMRSPATTASPCCGRPI